MRILVVVVFGFCLILTTCKKEPVPFDQPEQPNIDAFYGSHSMNAYYYNAFSSGQVGNERWYTDTITLSANNEGIRLKSNTVDSSIVLELDTSNSTVDIRHFGKRIDRYLYHLNLDRSDDSIHLDVIHAVSPGGSAHWEMNGRK